jgi:hypothetical protein
MQFLIAIAALAGIVWAAVRVSRGSLLVGSAAFLIVGGDAAMVGRLSSLHRRPIPSRARQRMRLENL